MFANDVVLNTKTYSLRTQRTNNSIRSVAARPLSEPLSLTISHETSTNGRVSSVIYLTDTKTINTGTSVIKDDVKVQVKFQYNPISGRTDTEAAIGNAIADLISFLTTENVDKLLNLES